MPRIQELEYLKYTTNNSVSLKNSSECACVYCFKKYNPNEITEWCDYNSENVDVTAICPFCGIDSVIPNDSVKYTDDDLIRWHKQGFE